MLSLKHELLLLWLVLPGLIIAATLLSLALALLGASLTAQYLIPIVLAVIAFTAVLTRLYQHS